MSHVTVSDAFPVPGSVLMRQTGHRVSEEELLDKLLTRNHNGWLLNRDLRFEANR